MDKLHFNMAMNQHYCYKQCATGKNGNVYAQTNKLWLISKHEKQSANSVIFPRLGEYLMKA